MVSDSTRKLYGSLVKVALGNGRSLSNLRETDKTTWAGGPQTSIIYLLANPRKTGDRIKDRV